MVSWIGSSALGFVGTASRLALNIAISSAGLFYLLLRPEEAWDAVQPHIGTGLSAAIQGVDGLAEKAEATARAPWPSKLPCPRCGASADRLTVDYRPDQGHTLIHTHADGTKCEDKPRPDNPAGPTPTLERQGRRERQ